MMGGSAAIVAKSAAAPIKRVKLLLQNQGEMIKTRHLTRSYTGLGSCFVRIFREEGVLSFWRGHLTRPYTGYFKTRIRCFKEKDDYLKWFAGNVASGSADGATTLFFMYHLDYARTRLGNDAKECSVSGRRQFKGMLDVYRKTLSSDGVKGLCFGVSILGITLYRGMYFRMYDTIKPIVF
ncbi:unnamed protein product [Brassica rapa]|uniref:ADP/ATP translocase n=1 Tax=Brassica campestris TaxID=3711 RepID=A0A3P6CAE3_BRACM|nr:unnamed protein product [Brassica rapa]VDD11198.1 unnamed protein product [Brassica rapa]